MTSMIRFRVYVGILIGVLIITGIFNSIGSIMPVTETSVSSGYKIVIRIKILLAVCLFIIYGVNAFLHQMRIKQKKIVRV